MSEPFKASIIIPSYGRADSLETCISSIGKGTIQPHEIIIEGEKGELTAIRNKGAARASGSILIFIDDDVETTPKWLESIMETFRDRNIVGVSGPAIVRDAYRQKRDIFRFKRIKAVYDFLFLEKYSHLPGRITRAGTWTTGACEEGCSYRGEVDYLEACNTAIRRETFEKVGGFDERFRGIGDWSEPDLSFRIKHFGRLFFNPEAKLYHNPSRTGAFLGRAKTGARLQNYYLFAARWIKPNWRHSLFKRFLETYYLMKELGLK